MFYIVPSNRQEYLLKVLIALLDSDYQQQRLGIFESSNIMVESLGMKHYVNMGIARESNVAMNLDFPLVSRGIYNLCRAILGENAVPKESLFKREIMVWRIEQVLRSEAFQQSGDAKQANIYWQSAHDQEKARFLLAQNTADVFEQYMQFRPEWFSVWENNESVLAEANESLEPWQRKIWQCLVAENTSHPAKIIKEATQAFTPGNPKLPKVIYIFVVNALTPDQLEFLFKISEQVDIYFFHLNPCMEYWGDLLSDKASMHLRLKQGIDLLLAEASPNSLLANLGKQGRVLFNQLQDIEYPDLTDLKLFASHEVNPANSKPSLLGAIQQDLLQAQTGILGELPADNTVSIHSCHNHVREIQVLHDFLLHIIDNHKALDASGNPIANSKIQPHDIIVLCPAVEEYAPYVKSVFRSAYEKDDPNNPRLVCSIADRAPLDADPMASMFMDMLNLPDSRFSVTSLIDYLHIESVQAKFDLSSADVELCERWINDANIFWGKNARHKAQSLGSESSSELYTWEWGLARLLKSALYADSYEDEASFAMLHNLEGQNVKVLGKLMLFVQTLQNIDNGLRKPKLMQDWLNYMQTDILQTLFDESDDNRVLNTLKKAIEQISANIIKAKYHEQVSLAVARESLDNVLSRPDPLNQFNTGQVTFGSMVPMRSVPFKVVCILGLNDGLFPRSAQPLSIDLMVNDTPKPTDRSRRNEDRYMFLEALVSARDYLFLSYQGRSVKDNSVREPSLVLREFSDYLQRAFKCDVRHEHPLQAFSPKAFQANNASSNNWSEKPSFSNAWLKVANEKGQTEETLKVMFELPRHVYAEDLLQVFNDPLEAFATQHLQLSFDRFMDAQDDTEPFEIKGLARSIISTTMLSAAKAGDSAGFAKQIERMYQAGTLPEVAKQPQMYSQAIEHLIEDVDFSTLETEQTFTEYTVNVPVGDSQITLFGIMEADETGTTNILSTRNIGNADIFGFYLQHAIKRKQLGHNVTSTLYYLDMKSYLKECQAFQDNKRTYRPHAALLSTSINDEVFDSFKIDAFLAALVKAYQHCMQVPSLLHIEIGANASVAVAKARKAPVKSDYELDDISKEHKQQEAISKALNESLESTIAGPYFANDYLRYFYPSHQDTAMLVNTVNKALLEQVYWAHLPEEWEL
jgi:exodeoxyribonuclease V gamma subunit